MFSARDYYEAANRCTRDAIQAQRLGHTATAVDRRKTAGLYRFLGRERAQAEQPK